MLTIMKTTTRPHKRQRLRANPSDVENRTLKKMMELHNCNPAEATMRIEFRRLAKSEKCSGQ